MQKEDRADWYAFRNGTSSSITHEEYVMVSQLHSKYFKHKYSLPCKCNPRTINGWIEDLNKMYETDNNNE